MRSWIICCSVVASLAVSVPQYAVGQVLYDNFNAANHFIDINKWAGFETRYRGTEANRRIDAGKLRITARGAGLLTTTPTGTIFSDFGLGHPNPNSITLLQTTVEVVEFDAVACPVNPTVGAGEARAIIRGAFFNSGTPTPGNLTNDVIAQISLVRRSNAAADTVAVEADMFRCTNAICSTSANGQRFNLGTLSCPGRLCPPVTLRITWEQALNRFRFLRGAVGALPVLEQIANYTLPDANLAGLPARTLSVAPVPATCTAAAGRKTAFMDVLFDNVFANVVNVGPNAAGGFDAVDLGEVLGTGEIPVP